jgi:predicted methyltransferase
VTAIAIDLEKKRRSAARLAAIAVAAIGLVPSAGARAADASALAEALARPTRSEVDRARDAGRKPAEVIAFLGVEPGMTAIDLIAAAGYYTEVLSTAVGESGKVYAQNTEFVLKMREGANEKAMSARLADGRLANVERLDREIAELGLEPGSIDVAITALNFHDIYNGRGPEAASRFLKAVGRLLKPGGVLGLIDHAGRSDGDNEALHRIDEALVEAAVTDAGFAIDGRSDVLRNAEDDRSQNVFTPGLRGHTDRFVLRLRKPN